MSVESQEQLEQMLEGIEMRGTRFEDWSFDWRVEEIDREGVEVLGWHVRSSFERPDVDGERLERGYGRRWFVEPGSSVERVVFTAWLAIRQIVEHELHESFTVNVGGRRVRLLDPHKSLEDLAVGSREAASGGIGGRSKQEKAREKVMELLLDDSGDGDDQERRDLDACDIACGFGFGPRDDESPSDWAFRLRDEMAGGDDADGD